MDIVGHYAIVSICYKRKASPNQELHIEHERNPRSGWTMARLLMVLRLMLSLACLHSTNLDFVTIRSLTLKGLEQVSNNSLLSNIPMQSIFQIKVGEGEARPASRLNFNTTLCTTSILFAAFPLNHSIRPTKRTIFPFISVAALLMSNEL
ncbi:uncharacterized protein K444DRAFT_366012 [Hyaloscypha bicolor E]|uniref:Uncharacterized protein n=1 Tax=Hyaloscypha bicolor E TaxID=1095630 RepID=A0A2J6TDX7_9HELO|nr:uncharacterized protein K444DRAFT_366012 [Hyaloscypha bicolor E]PMD61235.1 hypothetical protein K444DRAFT_366012 [Hyaloscypha bicolor E]